MEKFIWLTFFIIMCTCGNTYSQNIFPETFDDCNTGRFALESDSTTANIEDSKLIEVLSNGIKQGTLGNVNGFLALQIIVGLDGSSCLLSYKNDLNIDNFILKLKKEIDENLTWQKPSKKVAAILSIRILNGNLEFKRLGINGKKGVHVLKD